jgi:hypothetical protein
MIYIKGLLSEATWLKNIKEYRHRIYEDAEYSTLEDAKIDIESQLKINFPKYKIHASIVAITKIVIFYITASDFRFDIWWEGLKNPTVPYSIYTHSGTKAIHAKNIDELISSLKKILSTWSAPEAGLNLQKISVVIAKSKTTDNFKSFGFRADNKFIQPGEILGASFNGMGDLSVTGVSTMKLPGVSTVGISRPHDKKAIILAWRAFKSLKYEENFSLVGGFSEQPGDDDFVVRMAGQDYYVEEYVIRDGKVLALLNNAGAITAFAPSPATLIKASSVANLAQVAIPTTKLKPSLISDSDVQGLDLNLQKVKNAVTNDLRRNYFRMFFYSPSENKLQIGAGYTQVDALSLLKKAYSGLPVTKERGVNLFFIYQNNKIYWGISLCSHSSIGESAKSVISKAINTFPNQYVDDSNEIVRIYSK